jgi:putative transposase
MAHNPFFNCPYITMTKGFAYLVVIMDWGLRVVLIRRLSNPPDSHFSVRALEEALGLYRHLEIFNTDQEARFTFQYLPKFLKEE